MSYRCLMIVNPAKYDNNGCAGGTGAKRRGDVLVR